MSTELSEAALDAAMDRHRWEFAKTFQEARVAAGLSQAKLAYRSGVSLSSIANLENARTNVRLETLLRLAIVLNLKVDVTEQSEAATHTS